MIAEPSSKPPSPPPSVLRQAQFGLRVASLGFGLLSCAHLIRVWMEAELRVGVYSVSLMASQGAFLVTAGLGLWLWKLALRLNPLPKSAVVPEPTPEVKAGR